MSTLLSIDQIRPAPWNPRGAIDDASLGELVESIRAQGILTPLLVRGGHLDAYEIVAGHRRFRAAQILGLAEVPVVVRGLSDDEAREAAIVENLQREGIPAMDEARAFEALLQHGTPASIAQRIGKPERYVWDRLRLLQLVPDAQRLLTEGRLPLPHALILAKLPAAAQTRAIDPDYGGRGALFEIDHARTFEDLERHHGGTRTKAGKWDHLKPRSLREFRAWVATHVRFDPVQAAEAAPLDFGPVADQVTAAVAQPGRGRKVIHITRDHFVQPSARDADGARTYCVQAWKRADGQEKSKPCDRSVLGVVVVGPGYGEAFQVCVHKDCDIHWKAERQAREKRQAAAGSNGGSASRRAHQDAEDRKAQARQVREEAARQAWEAERPAAAQAFAQHLGHLPFSEQVVRAALGPYELQKVARDFGVTLTKKTAAAVLVLSRIELWDRGRFLASTKPWKFAWKPPKAEPPTSTTDPPPARRQGTASPGQGAKHARGRKRSRR